MTVSRPLNLIEKLILRSTIGGDVEDFRPGGVVLLKVDWILASELSWTGMDTQYERIGRPAFPRPERFWLAADHIVDPRINHVPKVKRFIDSAERIAREQPIDYQPPNTTIMHTEFARNRAQPGQVIIGADSHSCSAGCVGALAMGLGSTDTLLALITGRTFLQIPEVICLRLEGAPPPGVGGKDIVLHILGTLKRNTVAMERAVEISGPGLAYLSTDARFAICNMMTEFGALTGVCTPDSETNEYVNMRQNTNYKSESIYLKADEGCSYAGVYTINLSEVSSLVALFPSPDNTVPAKELVAGQGLKLDGCFIGACTTAFEDLVLAALVLEQAMKDGMKPSDKGHRKVTPGSRKIIQSLEQHKLTDVYRQAGFEIGIPGCSYCVGLGADKAKEGEVWLSSQNRNFRNRMGTGSIANLASAATVAISSFDMALRDPGDYLNKIDRKRLARICGKTAMDINFEPVYTDSITPSITKSTGDTDQRKVLQWPAAITSGVQRFGDNIDTDSISPGDLLMKASEAKTDEETGEVCFYHDRPEYRSKARNGFSILVAGEGFGCGSSRETAATAIKGCGTQAIIAKSYSFIFRRNAANNALPALQIDDSSFYSAVDEAGETAEITIYFETAEVAMKGRNERWPFMMSAVDGDLLKKGGAMQAYQTYGKDMYD